MGFFERLKEGLRKTRASFTNNMDQIFNSYEKVTEEFYDDREETMIMGDIGVRTTEELLDHLRGEVQAERIKYAADCRQEDHDNTGRDEDRYPRILLAVAVQPPERGIRDGPESI